MHRYVFCKGIVFVVTVPVQVRLYIIAHTCVLRKLIMCGYVSGCGDRRGQPLVCCKCRKTQITLCCCGDCVLGGMHTQLTTHVLQLQATAKTRNSTIAVPLAARVRACVCVCLCVCVCVCVFVIAQ